MYGAEGRDGSPRRVGGFRDCLAGLLAGVLAVFFAVFFVGFFGVSSAPHTATRYPDISPLIPR